MLKLITDSMNPENPTIPIRWCIDPSDRVKLLEFGADNIHVLIVTAYENGAEDRQVRPLAEAMTYVGFRFPGTHVIHARLVWPHNSKHVKKMVGWFLERQNPRKYENEVLDYERTEIKVCGHVSTNIKELSAAESLDVLVDVGHFAKEPPEW